MGRRSLDGVPQDLDMEIIAHLQEDARKPFTAIAEELGLPESTIRKRVTRLQKQGLLHFTVFADPLRLGFQYWSLIQVKIDLSMLEATAAQIARSPEIFFVGITAGEYNLFVAGVFRSNADLLTFLTTRLPDLPGFEMSATSNVLRIVKRRGPLFGHRNRLSPGHHPRVVPLAPAEGTLADVDLLDKQVIAQFQMDGRRSFAQVATTLGISEATVHKRIARLKELGILRFEAFADPLRLGFQYWALINFSVAPKRVLEVAATLAEFPELFFVGITTGHTDVFVAGVFRSNDELLRFLSDGIGRNPWIRSVSTTNVLKLVKRQLVYPLSADLTAGVDSKEKR